MMCVYEFICGLYINTEHTHEEVIIQYLNQPLKLTQGPREVGNRVLYGNIHLPRLSV